MEINKIFVVLTILLIGSMFMISGCGTQEEEEKVIKIGAIMPMTGNLAYFGDSYSTGAELAIDEINNAGGINGKKLEMVLLDNQEDPQTTVTNFYQLFNLRGINLMLIPMTRPSLAIKDIAEQQKVIVFSQTITYVNNSFTFKDFYDTAQLGKEMGNIILDTNSKKLCIFVLNTADGNNIVNSLKQGYVQSGGDLRLIEKFERTAGTQIDFKTSLIKVKDAECDGLYAFLLPNTMINLLKQIEELDMTNLNFFTVQIQDPIIMADNSSVSSLNSMKTTISSWFSVDTNKNINYLKFKEAYIKKFGKEPKGDTAYTYDDVKILATAMKKCDDVGRLYEGDKINTDCIRNEILNVQGYQGAAGVLSFNGSSNAQRDLYFEIFVNGSWISYK